MDMNLQIASQAGRRWQERTATREAARDNLAKGNITAVESTDRIMDRINHLSAYALTRPGAILPDTGRKLVDGFASERILGENDLLGFNILELALAVGRFVGRINIRSSSTTLGFGTGFMVSPRLLLTNNHVLSAPQDAVYSMVEFDYQLDRFMRLMPVRAFRLEPDTFFMTSPDLDFTLVAVHPLSVDNVELKNYTWSKLIENQGKTLIGEPLNIIQHPNAEPKHIAFRHNRLIDLLENFAHYETDTEPGSSGSPVYNDQWEIIALHHSGVPNMKNGQIIAKDGSVWKDGMDPALIDWVANEGIRVSSLVGYIKQQNLTGTQAQLRDDLLNLEPPNPLEVADRSNLSPVVSSAVKESPSANEWIINIPLQISIRLGTPSVGGNISPQTTISTTPPTTPLKAVIKPAEPAVPQSPTLQPQEDPDVRQALAELEEAPNCIYYDQPLDQQDCVTYYKDIPANLSSAKFYGRLNQLLTTTHKQKPVYKPIKEVYPWVDLHQTPEGLKIRSIYSGLDFDPKTFIEADFRLEQERQRLMERLIQESTFSFLSEAAREEALEASLPYNCEHVVPQSWFGHKEPMRGDLHHLFAVESGCNSFRGNTPYFDFPDFEEVIREDCGKREPGKFEPNSGKGSIARAVLYFLLRYPGEINKNSTEYTEDRIRILLNWHQNHPPDQYDKHRNQAIFQKQGNRNPLIDHPEWAEKINFLRGLGQA